MAKAKNSKGAGAVQPAQVPIGANDKINHAIIGLGSMGQGHVKYVLDDPQARLVAVSDVMQSRVTETIAKAGDDCRGYRDFREMLDCESIDVVHVVTPPHWHALQNIYALNAGCDVWAEKPMTRTIAEGAQIAAAVKRNSRVFRLNTWFRMHDSFYGLGTAVAPLKKLIQSGALGWPLTVRISAHTGFSWKASMWMGKLGLAPEPVPEGFDYDLWLGPAPYRPYTSHRTSGSFRGYWDYDGGGLGDMGQHYLDPVQYLLEKDHTSPIHIEVDAPPQHPESVGSFRRITMTYADGCKIILDGNNSLQQADAPFLEGPKGKLWPKMRSTIKNLNTLISEMPEPAPQQTNFMESIKLRRPFALNEVNGFRSCTIVNLALVAMRLGRSFNFDPVALRAVNDPAADRFIDQQHRGPWHKVIYG